MKNILILRNGLMTIFMVCAFFGINTVYASVAGNLFYDLATISEVELQNDWDVNGDGTRAGITLSSSGSSYYYTRNDLDISNGENWLIEAVVSAPHVGADNERGARLRVTFFDSNAPQVLPLPYRQLRVIELRLEEDGAGSRQFSLVDGTNGVKMANLNLDWAITDPKYRVRLKRQQIGSNDYIFIQAEPSKSGSDINWDDPSNPNPDPDTTSSKKVLLSAFGATTGVQSEFGFGNFVADTYTSNWESIHLTIADDSTTVLPYWPPEPPAPILNLTTTVPPHTVTSEVDLSGYSYLLNDAATLALNTLSGELTGTPILDPSTAPAQHTETFTGLAADQTVTGWVEVSDVSGRTTLSTQTQLVIPSSGVSALECVGFESPMNGDPVTVKKNRVLPLRAILLDTSGYTVTDAQIVSPPVIQVLFDDNTGGINPVDVSDDALPAGLGTDGNQFVFTDDALWQFNLKTKNYSAPGKYTIIMGSGDESEYTVDPTCNASFIIE